MIFLDTNVVVGLINRPSIIVRRNYKDALAAGTEIAVSSVVVFELRYGVAKSALRTKNAAVLSAFLDDGTLVLPFSSEDAEVGAEIRVALERAGTPIGAYDLLIAAQALRHGATLVTANVREFERVAGLTVVDWR